jgi:hypothetical protein
MHWVLLVDLPRDTLVEVRDILRGIGAFNLDIGGWVDHLDEQQELLVSWKALTWPSSSLSSKRMVDDDCRFVDDIITTSDLQDRYYSA